MIARLLRWLRRMRLEYQIATMECHMDIIRQQRVNDFQAEVMIGAALIRARRELQVRFGKP